MKRAFLFCLAISCFLSACENENRNVALLPQNTVVIGLSSDFDTLLELGTANSDALHVIEEMLFLTLNKLDENLTFQPNLATSWRKSADGTMLEFTLRDDVYWSDGQPTTAEDVLFSYQLAVHPETGYAARNRFARVDSVIVSDRYTVQFLFEAAYPDAQFDMQIPILPKHLLQHIPPAEIKNADFHRQPVGNGPYLLQEWRANDRVIFRANPNYFAGRPAIEHVVFRIIPDEAVLAASVVAGEIDVLPHITPGKIAEIEADERFELLGYPDRGYSFLAFNLKRPLLQDVDIRAAAAKAVNRSELLQTLLGGRGQPVSGPIMPYFPVYDSSYAAEIFDLPAAKAHLSKAGWRDSDGDGFVDKNGETLEFGMKTNADNQLRSDVLVMLQSQLKKAGIRAHIELVEWGKLVEDVMQKRDFDSVLLSWKTGFTVDPSQVWHSDAIASGFNLGSFRSAHADSLLEAAGRELDSAKAVQLWREFHRHVAESHPYIFLYSQENTAVVNRRIENVKVDVRGYLINVEAWKISQNRS